MSERGSMIARDYDTLYAMILRREKVTGAALEAERDALYSLWLAAFMRVEATPLSETAA